MERRDFITAAATIAAIGVASEAFAQGAGAASMHPPKYKALQDASGRCVAAGNDCLRHCLGMLSMKDVSMAGCTDSAYQVVAACGALQTLAAVNSTYLPAFARARGRDLHRMPERVREVSERRRVQRLRHRVQILRRGVSQDFRLSGSNSDWGSRLAADAPRDHSVCPTIFRATMV